MIEVQTPDVKVVTEEQLIKDMYDQFLLIDSHTAVIKGIKDAAKEAGFDGALLAKVAKAKADDKVSELTEKTEDLLTLLEEYGA